MEKIYIVTKGEYSDYHICAIFSSKIKAEKYCQAITKEGSWSTPQIEDYDLDEYDLKEGEHSWFVRMKKDGEVEEAYEDDSRSDEHGFDINKNLYSHVFATSKEHAIKITNERRAQLIAQNDWPSGDKLK